MGKGSKRRPEDKKMFDTNWEVIFGQAIPKLVKLKYDRKKEN